MKKHLKNIILMMGMITLLNSCGPLPKKCESKVIISIGGCDKDAVCAVMYSDMTFGKENYPIVGKVVNACSQN